MRLRSEPLDGGERFNPHAARKLENSLNEREVGTSVSRTDLQDPLETKQAPGGVKEEEEETLA